MATGPSSNARLWSTIVGVLRAGRNVGLATAVLLLGAAPLQDLAASGDTRTLSFLHLHTKEELTVTYKRDGRYDEEALKKINWIMRDWRRNEAIRMDLKVIDAVWEVYRDTGATQPIEIICGYRAPATNSMLRKRSGGVAKFSQHTLGRAIDLHIPGVSLEKQREAALRLHRGGVGFYPSSSFIHVDIAGIRHWPRMSYDQLARVFPNGRTVHTAANGRQLPGYQLALADIAKRGNGPSQMSLEATRTAGVDVTPPKPQKNLLASLFSGAKDAEEDEDAAPEPKSIRAAPARPPIRPSAKTASASLSPAAAPASMGNAQPEAPKAAAAAKHTDKPIRTASADDSIPRPPLDVPASAAGAEVATASIGAWPLREEDLTDRVPLELALAYAAVPDERPGPSLVRAAAMGSPADRAPGAANPAKLAGDHGPVTVVKKTYARLTPAPAEAPRAKIHTAVAVQVGMRFDDPWLRAAMFAPNMRTSLTTTSYGEPDHAELRPLMAKPHTALVMTFCKDPHHGLTNERFTGGAVVFLATVTFQRTALLR